MSPQWMIRSQPRSAASASGRSSPWVSEITPICSVIARPRSRSVRYSRPMALRSTVYRVGLDVSVIDRGYHARPPVPLPRRPSEPRRRLMRRLLAVVLHADPRLALGGSFSAAEEPGLGSRDDTGAGRLWSDVRLPDERRVRRAAGRSAALAV